MNVLGDCKLGTLKAVFAAKTLADLEYMAFPRLAGYAEIGWSAATGRNWDEYKVRLGAFGPRFKAWNVDVYKSSAVPWK